MHARWLSFVIWALLAASLAYWSLVLMARGPAAPGQVQPAISAGAVGDWTRLFTQEAPVAAEPASSRYVLLGVVAPKSSEASGEGVALISVAGGFARPFRVGQVVDGDLQLVEVNKREVGLGRNGNVSVRLALAPVAGVPSPSPAPNGLPVQPGGQQGGPQGNPGQQVGTMAPSQTLTPVIGPNGGQGPQGGLVAPGSVNMQPPPQGGPQSPPDNAVTQ